MFNKMKINPERLSDGSYNPSDEAYNTAANLDFNADAIAAYNTAADISLNEFAGGVA